ncbi:hypothetical protein OBB02_04375 [Candidatus Puniceispirillum sp.]|nr:hypothetical protein [Candidatus Puniceispirillum sp.]
MNDSGYLRAGALAVIGWFACAAAYAGDLVRPDPSIAPAEVVAIQLMGLKNNDIVETDFGIRQTWNFAHPKNRNFTGPFPRFAQMLKGPGYSVLLNHKSHEIRNGPRTSKGKTSSDELRKQFDVLLETANGDILYFSWVVQKVAMGQFKDCWMTVSVSMPRPAGQSG